MVIFIFLLIIVVAFFSFVAGAYFTVEGEFKLEFNKRIRKLKKNKERLIELERHCNDVDICQKYKEKIKEIEKMLQSEIYSEMGIQVDDKE